MQSFEIVFLAVLLAIFIYWVMAMIRLLTAMNRYKKKRLKELGPNSRESFGLFLETVKVGLTDPAYEMLRIRAFIPMVLIFIINGIGMYYLLFDACKIEE